MSSPREAEDVRLISSLFSPRQDLIEKGIHEMEGLFGPTDRVSPELLFDRTRYYEKEMGWPLYRRFISFRNLVRAGDIVDIKLATNALENQYRRDDRRMINIDPGYVSLERLVLVTGKNYTHRIYLSKGIYGDLTLIFKKGGFIPLQWTYRDYADPVIISYFNEIRERYKRDLRRRDI
ncbi:MAG: DUF4416 family protein [Pseudomonadota bacterium]